MAWARISIWELRLMLEQAIMDMLSLSFRPKVTIRRIRKSEADNLIVEGNYYFFGERGNFKATLKENKRELQILDLELMPKQ